MAGSSLFALSTSLSVEEFGWFVLVSCCRLPPAARACCVEENVHFSPILVCIQTWTILSLF
jgi:hypothetical protein